MEDLTLYLDGTALSGAIGQMNSSFNPSQVIATFEDLGVDVALMEGNEQTFVVSSGYIDRLSDIFEDAGMPPKMRLNNAILIVKRSMSEVLLALSNAD